MRKHQQQDQIRVLHSSQAFDKNEKDWFASFENSLDLWEAVDTLFPDDSQQS